MAVTDYYYHQSCVFRQSLELKKTYEKIQVASINLHQAMTFELISLLFICLFIAMGNASHSAVGEKRDMDTHMGKMSVRIVGSEGTGKIPVICIPGASEALVDEWVKVAAPLSENGYVVAIINFHSNPDTKPGIIFGGIQPHDVSRVINEAVLQSIFHAEKAIIMGKSWGGYMAYTHATAHPTKVIKLCLQAPAFSNHERVAALHKTGVPTFLAWARDDPLIWYSNTKTWLDGMGSDLVFYSAEKGGHAVIDEYAEPMIKFIKS